MTKTLLRLLLSLLINTQVVSSTFTDPSQIQSIASVTQNVTSESELISVLNSIGVTLDQVSPEYIASITEGIESVEIQTQLQELLQNTSTAMQPVTTTIDAETGLAVVKQLPAEVLNEVKYTGGGIVNALTSPMFLGSVLALLGVQTFGRAMYKVSPDFKNAYDEVNKDIAGYDDSRRYTAGFLALVNQRKQELGRELTEEEYNQLAEEYKVNYLSPETMSINGILRTFVKDSYDSLVDGYHQFMNRRQVEDTVKKLYALGLLDSVTQDIPTGYVEQLDGNHNALYTVVSSAVNRVNSMARAGGLRYTFPTTIINDIINLANTTTDFVNKNIIRVRANLSNYDYSHLYLETWDTHNVDGTISISGTSHNFTSNQAFYATFLTASMDNHTGTINMEINVNNSKNNSVISGLDNRQVAEANQVYVAIVNSYSTISEKSALVGDNSGLKYQTLEDAMRMIAGLPMFETTGVDKDGNLVTNQWIKMPVALKDAEDNTEVQNPDDYADEVDLTKDAEQQTVPDYVPQNIIARTEAEENTEITKPYGKDDITENTAPSPSDNIVLPSGGGGGGTKPSTPSGGGSPVIIPPIIPIGGSSSALFSVYNPSASEIDSLGTYLWSSNIIEIVQKFFSNPMDAIISLHQIYITPPTNGRKNIKLGYLDSGVGASVVTNQYTELDCGSVFVPEYYGDARDFSPWTQIQLYMPFIGIRPLSAEDIIGSIVNVKYGVDIYTGALMCSVTVTKPDGTTQTLYTFTGTCGVQYPLTGSNLSQMLSGAVSGAISGSAIGGMGGAVVGGLFGAMSGGASVERSGSFGSNCGAMGYKKPYIIINRKVPCDANSYGNFYGLPANKTVILAECSGYTRVKDINLSSINATEEEKIQIDELLKNGIFI